MKIVTVDDSGESVRLTAEKYLKYNMTRKVMTNITFPRLDDNYKYGSYKVTKRFPGIRGKMESLHEKQPIIPFIGIT